MGRRPHDFFFSKCSNPFFTPFSRPALHTHCSIVAHKIVFLVSSFLVLRSFFHHVCISSFPALASASQYLPLCISYRCRFDCHLPILCGPHSLTSPPSPLPPFFHPPLHLPP